MWGKFFSKIFSRRNLEQDPPEFSQLSEKAQRLVKILTFRARGNEVEISQAELAELTGWHRDTIWRYLREARNTGLLTWERRPNLPNIYRLVDVGIIRHPASHRRSRDRGDRLLHKVEGFVKNEVEGVLHKVDGPGAPPGRQEELREVQRFASKGAHTLILGWEGYGKTHLLRHLSHDGIADSTPCDAMIHFATPGPAKDFLLNLGEELVQVGDLQLDVEEGKDPYWTMNKLRVRQLHKVVHDSLAKSKNRYLLLIDDIDQISPTQKTMMQELLELRNVQVIATAKSQKPKLASLWHHFFTVGLSRLPKQVSDQLVEEFIEERGIPVADDWRKGKRWGGEGKGEGLKVLKERLYHKSRGNPRNLKAFLRKIEIEGYVDRTYLEKELGGEEDEPYIDMTWIIIATAAIIMAIRYLGLGLHDRGLYILAGTGYAATLILRYLSYRWKR